MKLWNKIKTWIMKKYDARSRRGQAKPEDLVWLKRNIKAGSKIDWSFVDTADYDIQSIPRKREVILEMNIKNAEAMEKWQSLLK